MIKAERIEETLEDFELEHPEIKVIRDCLGKVIYITFPNEATETSYTILGEYVQIHYRYKGVYINFS